VKFRTVSFGCKVNQYETQMMREVAGAFFEEAGDGEAPDAVLVNTCSVTAEADRQARQALRRARKKFPDARVIAAGCYARRPGVDLVGDGLADRIVAAPTSDAILAAFDLADGPLAKTAPAEAGITRFDGHTRAFVKVQDGCDRRCSFCVVPLIRGESTSRPAADVAAEVGRLAAGGVPEVVVCGIRLNAYRDPESGGGLAALLRRMLAESESVRFRLSSLYPGELDPEVIGLFIEDPRVVKHLHLPVQSGSDRVLKDMRRGYSSGDVLEMVRRLKAGCPDAGLTADVIAGYPTETEEDVAATIGLIEECGFHKLHLFPFSPRPGTPAAKLKPLPAAVVKERMARLAGVEARLLERSLERQVGREVNVTVEGRPADGWWKGLTESYHRVRVKGPSTPGLARVRISGVEGKSLLAVPVQEILR